MFKDSQWKCKYSYLNTSRNTIEQYIVSVKAVERLHLDWWKISCMCGSREGTGGPDPPPPPGKLQKM